MLHRVVFRKVVVLYSGFTFASQKHAGSKSLPFKKFEAFENRTFGRIATVLCALVGTPVITVITALCVRTRRGCSGGRGLGPASSCVPCRTTKQMFARRGGVTIGPSRRRSKHGVCVERVCVGGGEGWGATMAWKMLAVCAPAPPRTAYVHSTSTRSPVPRSTASPCRIVTVAPAGNARGSSSVQNPATSCGSVKR